MRKVIIVYLIVENIFHEIGKCMEVLHYPPTSIISRYGHLKY